MGKTLAVILIAAALWLGTVIADIRNSQAQAHGQGGELAVPTGYTFLSAQGTGKGFLLEFQSPKNGKNAYYFVEIVDGEAETFYAEEK